MIVVFWLDENRATHHTEFDSKLIGDAIKYCETQRNKGYHHVTISSELSSSVGKPGVDTVANGMTPDGVEYSWKKRRI